MQDDDVPPAARAAHARADECFEQRRFVEAVGPLEEAARLAPGWAAPWWTLTVAYKHGRRWADVLTAYDRAVALPFDSDAQGIHWNAGIAATALGDWPRARSAWAAAGIALPPGDGPIDLRVGPTPIRVSVHDEPDVVWCDRIDPCRARIVSVPIPESGRRHGDLVLHDGEPRGKRRLGERSLSVFDELALLEASSFRTWQVVIRCETREERDAVVEDLEAASIVVEDWTENLELMCAACSLSLGEAPPNHEHRRSEVWDPIRRLGVAARSVADLHPLRGAGVVWRAGVESVDLML
jgi:tetratricopeptide (TPR) repeat protein